MSTDASYSSERDRVRSDFDRIARLSEDTWDHNGHYHQFLLKHVPDLSVDALDVGCGTGRFTRILAKRFKNVGGLDLSPEMLRVARERSTACTNIIYREADALTCELPNAAYDCVVSIATLHHLPMVIMLKRLGGALRTGGVLVVHDLVRDEGIARYTRGAIALMYSRMLRIANGFPLRDHRELREAWDAHWKHDRILTLKEVRSAAFDVLPGARVFRHLLWRYTLVWKKSIELP